MTDTETWPYDAIQHDPLTALRIPVTGPHPGWYYTIALDLEQPCYIQGAPRRPNEAETTQLVSFLDYLLADLRDSYRAKLRERPFDIGVNAATRVFRKWGEDDWSYRLSSWERGPFYSPAAPNRRKTGERLSLVQVMDRAEYCDGRSQYPNKRWLDWKAAHPEAFGA